MPIVGGGSSGVGATALASAAVTLTSGNLTTGSTTFVDATGLTVTPTTGAHKLLIVFTGQISNSSAGVQTILTFLVDGVNQGVAISGGAGGLVNISNGAGFISNASMSFVTAAVTAAAHTVKVQWAVSAGTGTLYAATNAPATLTVVELLA